MQSHQDSFGTDNLKNRGHRRSDTLGKSMPVTSLLLNYTPSRFQNSENIRSDAGRAADGNISPTQQERPPLYFPIHETTTNRDVCTSHKTSEQPLDTDEEFEILEQEYEILVSECSSSNNGDSNHDEDRRKSNSEEYISLIGNSKFYAPCLTCVGSAPTELASRPSAINEMCRRLCTEECRLRLSLAGLVIPSDTILNNRQLLDDYVKDSLQKKQTDCNDTPPKLPPRPLKKLSMEHANEAEAKAKVLPINEKVNDATWPPALPLRPPANIVIQRKKFLTDMLMQNGNYSSEDEESNQKEPPKELLDIVTSIVVPPTTPPTPPTPTPSSSSSNRTELAEAPQNIQVDPHELAMLKDFREKFEIAEALAKTSAMTSTSKIKQRLAARKLEIDLENAKAIAAQTKHENKSTSPASCCTSTSSCSNEGDANYTHQTAYVQGVTDAVTTQHLSHTNRDAVSTYYDDYEPPRDLLLYLVR